MFDRSRMCGNGVSSLLDSEVCSMPDDDAFDHKDDVFGNVCCVVGDSFDVTSCREQVQGWFDQIW